MKIFISQPMRDKSAAEIIRERENAIRMLKEKYGEGIDILDTHFTDYDGNAVQFLGKSIMKLGEADLAVFLPGYSDARGCKLEHAVADSYGIETLEVMEGSI